jgi:hypothetical protein
MKLELDRTIKGAHIIKVKHEIGSGREGVTITSGTADTLAEAASWCLRNLENIFRQAEALLLDLGATDIAPSGETKAATDADVPRVGGWREGTEGDRLRREADSGDDK